MNHLSQKSPKRLQQLLGMKRLALKLIGDGLDDLGVAVADVEDAVAAQKIEVLLPVDVLEAVRAVFPVHRDVFRGHRFAVLENTGVDVVGVVSRRLLRDPGLVLLGQFGLGHQIEHALGFLQYVLR